ncbi:hypothetical protein DS2_05535 [Catenovulum agarivorans DS-2]|uniref:KANL3/Tex30 alpha/beta hydrolase-like domain-containing protein n=1 Tax=Catenovulum agarivorans DS-2 TaxID=1328313 RepID=W7R058_9ALTE|nr:alpha/beta family hydrolase [Catenovulum agarivorans]EWH11005.1 hypothetical protein DS2_05535 [Catenovulum agarivorans DS-2]
MTDVKLILAHGAGAGSQSEFMQSVCNKLTEFTKSEKNYQLEVILFDFPYMQQIHTTGKKRPPDKMPKLVEAFKQQVLHLGEDDIVFVAGKSMGARVALETILATDRNIRGAIALGYPFYPPGKPEKHRLELISKTTKPCLIVQGERDTFGNRDWVSQQAFSNNIKVNWLKAADHSLKPLKSSGVTHEQALDYACHTIIEFINEYV